MPRLVLINQDRAIPLVEEPFLQESELQTVLEHHPELIALDEVDASVTGLIPIGREVSLAGQSLDLLFLDAAGRLTAVEAKLRKNAESRRTVVGQTLEYASYLSSWTIDEIEHQAERYYSDSAPERFRGMSVWSALSQLSAGPSEERVDEEEMRLRVAERIKDQDMSAVIAVDRIVDPLRQIVGFVNSMSRFNLYLLEVLEHRAPSGERLASINVYGGNRHSAEKKQPARGVWDEAWFLEKLESQAKPEYVKCVEALSRFIQEEADSVVWGTGVDQGSIGFGVRRGNARFTVFGVTTKGEVYISAGTLNKHVPRDARSVLSQALERTGMTIGESLLEGEAWLSFDGMRICDEQALAEFKSAVLLVRDAL